ncbi:MAG: ATP-binding cassette domain-containing protein, partial [Candidatus Dormibacteria bacterium]
GEGLLEGVPGGLQGGVQEEGRNLTATQRQMIALARAWLVRPEILVLDEATANLPPAMEQDVLRAVALLGKTTLFVTHRMPVAASADAIVVVDRGGIVERGTHRELLAANGTYRNLWNRDPEVEHGSGVGPARAIAAHIRRRV